MSHATVRRIRTLTHKIRTMSDEAIKTRFLELKYQAMSGAKINEVMVPAFALVVEASRRSLDQIHYDVQLQAGIHMINGNIAEMKTGEGKTLTASLAAATLALYGKGLHVVTFNDYLAKRDQRLIGPIFSRLGLTSSVIYQDLPDEQRKSAYACDVTYGPANEFGFDFLRDRIRLSDTGDPESSVMRGTNYALIDEADSILIDEARTPLVIGMVNTAEENIRQDCFRWAARFAPGFEEGNHYSYDEIRTKVTLTATGISYCRQLPQNNGTKRVSIRELYTYIENAIKVHRDFHLDKTYAVINGEIVIIDEFTGRPAEGRQWQGGIHQSVQAKEGVDITPATQQAASITIQSFFKRYKMFCGMTGTVWTSRSEIKKVYRKNVVRIPTNRPVDRRRLSFEVLTNQHEKFAAIAKATQKLVIANRAVLIGTRSVGKSELLAKTLSDAGVDFQILNARHLEREADIVAAAGQTGRVTIATNMAGRGTDIKLDDAVKAAGGLHVILTEIHESERIDWQLIGRGSRQGDPGSYQIFVSLDDEILTLGLGQAKAMKLKKSYQIANRNQLRSLFNVFRKAQRNIERKHLTDRLIVLKNDIERQKLMFETGQDPYLNTVSG